MLPAATRVAGRVTTRRGWEDLYLDWLTLTNTFTGTSAISRDGYMFTPGSHSALQNWPLNYHAHKSAVPCKKGEELDMIINLLSWLRSGKETEHNEILGFRKNLTIVHASNLKTKRSSKRLSVQNGCETGLHCCHQQVPGTSDYRHRRSFRWYHTCTLLELDACLGPAPSHKLGRHTFFPSTGRDQQGHYLECNYNCNPCKQEPQL